MVPAGRPSRGHGRNLPGSRLHGHQALGLGHVGEPPAWPGRHVQGHRASERILPAVHSQALPREGGRARRGLRARARCRNTGWRQRARGALRHPPDLRDDHRSLLLQVDRLTPRPPAPHQPVGERHALGAAHPHLPAHGRVPLAGGTHGALHARRGSGGGAAYARHLSRHLSRGPRCPGDSRREDRERALRWRRRDALR